MENSKMRKSLTLRMAPTSYTPRRFVSRWTVAWMGRCYIRKCRASVPREALSPTPPGPEGSNGNGLLRVQWVAGAWLFVFIGLVDPCVFPDESVMN